MANSSKGYKVIGLERSVGRWGGPVWGNRVHKTLGPYRDLSEAQLAASAINPLGIPVPPGPEAPWWTVEAWERVLDGYIRGNLRPGGTMDVYKIVAAEDEGV